MSEFTLRDVWDRLYDAKCKRSPGEYPKEYIEAQASGLMDGKRVRFTMASRFGDLGVSFDLDARWGYSIRVALDADITDIQFDREVGDG